MPKFGSVKVKHQDNTRQFAQKLMDKHGCGYTFALKALNKTGPDFDKADKLIA